MPKGQSVNKSAGRKADKKGKNKGKDTPNRRPPSGMSQARYDKLVQESQAPYKGLRKFFYASFGASGAIGGFVFFAQVLSGRDVAQALPNLALQIGVVALMVFLFRWEDRNKEDS